LISPVESPSLRNRKDEAHAPQEATNRNFSQRLETATRLKARTTATDRLIGQVAYRLDALTEQEIIVVQSTARR